MHELQGQNCVKCGVTATVVPVQTTSIFYCHDCYVESLRSKFRSTLSKTKLFKSSWNPSDEPTHVLILFYWDSRARVLLQFIDELLNAVEVKKRFRINPTIYAVHTERVAVDNSRTTFKDFTINNIHLSAMLNDGCDQERDITLKEKLESYNLLLDAATTKSIEYELSRLMFDLLAWRLANQLGLKIVMTAENSEAIAQKSMSALWFGRSTSLNEIAGVVDGRHSEVKIVRPLRNIGNAEIELLLSSDKDADFTAFSDSLSSSFLSNVANNGFPSVVSTILSVTAKLGVESALSDTVNKLKKVSIRNQCPLCQKEAMEKLCEPCQRLMAQIDKNKHTFVLSTLCFC